MNRFSYAGVLFVCLSGAAISQETTSADALPEVIVTAQKRSENVQKVPIAITAITASALTTSVTTDAQQLTALIPTLNYSANAGFATPFLRGIGTDVESPGAESSVATYIDGVYVGFEQGAVLDLYGVDRIEVLAGPQGTLYGRNASAGAINVYTLTPQQKFEQSYSAGFGNFANAKLTANVSGGLADSLAIGFYGQAQRRDSIYSYDPLRPAAQSDTFKSIGGRVKAVWTPTDLLKFTGSLEYDDTRSPENGVRNVQPNALGYTLGAPAIIKYRVRSSDVDQHNNTISKTAVLREEAALGFGDLVGISSYRRVTVDAEEDIDGTTAPVIDLQANINATEYAQELHLQSAEGSKIPWIGGVYFYHESGGFEPFNVRSPILFQPLPVTNLQSVETQSTTSYAVFAQASLPLDVIADGLQITLGGRYSHDRKGKDTQIQTFLLPDGSAFFPPTSLPPLRTTWTKFTPKVTLDYQTDKALFYATYAKGFKSGTYNSSSFTDNNPVEPENLTDYEVGMKSDLLDKRLRFNLAAYYYSFKNLQVEVISASGGVSASLQNAAAAKAYGIEPTITALLTDRLTVNAAVAWQQSEYTSFPNSPFWSLTPFGNTQLSGVSAAGNSLTRAPRNTGTISANYVLPVAAGGQVDFNASYNYNSGFAWLASGQFRQPSYQLFNGSVSYTSNDKHWKTSLWIKNIADEKYQQYLTVSGVSVNATDAMPRMYGVSVSWQSR